MKKFEDRSPAFQRRSNAFSTYGLGGVSLFFAGLFVLAGIAMLAMGAYAVVTRVF